jgi:hypothetical protein
MIGFGSRAAPRAWVPTSQENRSRNSAPLKRSGQKPLLLLEQLPTARRLEPRVGPQPIPVL